MKFILILLAFYFTISNQEAVIKSEPIKISKTDYISPDYEDIDDIVESDNISFLQTKTKFNSKNKSKSSLKSQQDEILDEKSSGTRFSLEQLTKEIPKEIRPNDIDDPLLKLKAQERDISYKEEIMLKLQKKVFNTSKTESFQDEFSVKKATKNEVENSDDFVAFIGFLGDTAKKYS